MRSTYIGLAAVALCWTGVLSAAPAKEDGSAAEMGMMVGRRLVSRIKNRHRNATSDFAELGLRQDAGQCGPQYGKCPGDACCSSYGFCGETIDHCHPLFDCQPNYGVCGWPRVPATTSTTARPPTTSTSTTSSTTTTSRPPITTPPTSSTTTTTRTSTSSGPTPTGPLVVTTNGMCGNNTMCIGNPNYGPCCSQFFWCGSTMEFCGAGCQSEFGACFGVPGQPGNPPTNGTVTSSTSPGVTSAPPTTTPTTTRAPPTTSTTTTSAAPTVSIPAGMRSSTDGKCGNNVTCLGSTFGRCCSQFGYCGDGDQFCPYIVGCQPEFGYCEPQ